MDLTKLKPGAIYMTGQVLIATPLGDRPTGYQSCRIQLLDGWCYIELNEADGEGSIDVYPASQVQGIVNLHGPLTGPPKPEDAVPAGEHVIKQRPAPARVSSPARLRRPR